MLRRKEGRVSHGGIEWPAADDHPAEALRPAAGGQHPHSGVGMRPAATVSLRARLIALRADALAQLAAGEGLDAGLLRLAADTTIVLAALDAEAGRAAAVAPHMW